VPWLTVPPIGVAALSRLVGSESAPRTPGVMTEPEGPRL